MAGFAVKRTDLHSRVRLSLALPVLAVLLALWLPPAPALTWGGGIEVVRSDREVGLPDGVSFTLIAEGEQDIVEVRLLYHALGSDVWSYAYADFNPGQRVTAKLNLSVTGADYLPPGTEVEYYYLITDVRGNVHRTDPKVVEVIDQRFEWDRTQVDSLLLLHHDLSPSKVAVVAEQVETSLGHIRGLLGVGTGRPMKGVIYNSNTEASDAFPRQSQTITDSQVFAGFAFPPRGIFVGVGFRTGIISHEAAHILFKQALGDRALPAPAWLNEGFANYVQPGGSAFSGRSLSTRGIPLTAMTRVSGTPLGIATFYQKATSVVAYLIEEFGTDSFRSMVGELALGRTTDDALLRTYGFDTSQLEARWAAEGEGPSAPPPASTASGNPWASFSSLVMGTLAVAVMLYVAARYAVRKLRPTHSLTAHEIEEGLQPWEDPDLVDQDDHELLQGPPR